MTYTTAGLDSPGDLSATQQRCPHGLAALAAEAQLVRWLNKGVVPIRWTHIAIPVSDIDGSIRFFAEVCRLFIVRDRRLEGGRTVWVGPVPDGGELPEFVIVLVPGEVREPLDHFGFECDSRDEVSQIAEQAQARGTLVEGPIDAGGTVGYYVVVREPSGHLIEFTHGQPLKGLGS